MSHLPLLPAAPTEPTLADILADLRAQAGPDFGE